ncbi:hypothetical protein BsWGS_00482 [Bradybaena similaris]
MSLKVLVIGATNVPNPETFGKSDPYAALEFQGFRKKTEVLKGDLNPKWNETIEFQLLGNGLTDKDELIVTVFDWERVGRNRQVGTAKIPLAEFVRGGSRELSVPLLDANQRQLQASSVELQITCVQPTTAAAGGPGEGGPGKVVELDADEDEDEDEVDAGSGDAGQGGKAGFGKKKARKKRKLKARENLSTKPTDQQVRVKVVQARQLTGANLQPIVRVSLMNQVKQTRIQKSTTNPWWDESFFFNFHTPPSELVDEIIDFSVYNSRTLRSDALIGGFKCDVGLIYDEPKHALVNKWVLISDPEEATAGAKGYLKISACVLGPGDVAPNMTAKQNDEDEDIESNLLRPAGVQLRPATFTLHLFCAEDIPRMDSAFLEGVKKVFNVGNEQKELVDPYFVFAFAGKEVKSKIIYACDHPCWYQKLNLGLQFPSMCERIKLQIRDWDRVNADDCICTDYLSVSLLSSLGEKGFLPTFGPCYINLYGSTREYSDLPNDYEDLNLGKGEGVAYRGRALVQLETILGELPEKPDEDILGDDKLRVEKFMRRRKYRVHAAFYNASLISTSMIDAPIEFEVSIGNYGNKLDENVPPCASTTQPTNAVFDGSYYYFLPWANTKPCVVVDCSWEDISFRLESLNMMLSILDRLQSNLDRIRIGIKARLPVPELAQLLISLLDQLIVDCNTPLSPPKNGQHSSNELDKLTEILRKDTLQSIKNSAITLRENATDLNEAVSEVEQYLSTIKNITAEPQNSMPDVIIWMLCGQKRMAYYRIPAYELLYSETEEMRGKNCGKVMSIPLRYPQVKDKGKKPELPAVVRFKMWLGLQTQDKAWHKMQTDGELAVFAETYENQVNILGSWTNKGPTMTRPKWSDIEGRVELKKEDFIPPPGWKWEGDWYISPEMSMLFDKDAGHHTYLEDVYECQSRNVPGTAWGVASRPWADVKGDPATDRNATPLPEGWKWDDDWQIDLNRAVDEEGWEYCVESTIGGYGPVEKTYHLCRRRRWLRPRTHVTGAAKRKEKIEEKQKKLVEGWEYAPLFNLKFHAQERTIDLVRRRRWHRKMVSEGEGGACFFNVQHEGADQQEKEMQRVATLAAPRMFLTFKEPHKYQLRAYIYQARDLLAADDTGLSDPFVRVAFMTQSMVTEKQKKTLSPTWDQTLIFSEVEIYGNPSVLEVTPPEIYIELFDYDTFGKPEFLGRTKALPMVKLDPADPRTPVLQWHSINRTDQDGGELLAAFELIKLTGKDLQFLPPKRGDLYIVPNGIRPVMQRTGIEVLCWGVRNMKKFQLSAVTSPSVRFECGGHVQESVVIKDTRRNPNFSENLLFFDVMLPREELYMPPMSIKVKDHRQFGRKPTVGVHILRSLEEFRIDPLALENISETSLLSQDEIFTTNLDGLQGQDVIVDIPEGEIKEKESPLSQLELDWWSKFYASTNDFDKCKKYRDMQYDTLEILQTELENSHNYNGFADFCHTLTLSRGKEDDDEDDNTCGEFKGSFRVYPLPPDPNEPLPPRVFQILPASDPEECLVRVYVIQATDLQPSDPNGLADPYLEVELGKVKINTRDDYVPNSINPMFGRLFELKALIPIHKDLKIRVKDYDLLSSDDTVGETTIDLENRYLTKFRATCGLPKTYWESGVNAWRDSQKPADILTEYCKKNRLEGPTFSNSNTSVKVGNKQYNLIDFEKNMPASKHWGPEIHRLALHVLNQTSHIKEHVEARALYNPLQPSIEQGRLHMWVDIFPNSVGPPGPPFDITARKPSQFVLRCVIWNTKDVILEEEAALTGEKMSDIYVQGWMSGIDEKQKTDVHYRSLDGEGNFNWRFVFPFDYQLAEQTMIVKKKEHFWSLDETELRTTPKFVLQIWDNDKFSRDDFIGHLELNLNAMPQPTKFSKTCKLTMLPDVNKDVKLVSLFEMKHMKGFWPCYSDTSGKRILAGKIEMELELVSLAEAEERPAGQGRDDPNMYPKLDPPKRPETSFLWFTSPWKTLKFVIWRNYRCLIITTLIVLLLLLLIGLFIYSFPEQFSRYLVGNH